MPPLITFSQGSLGFMCNFMFKDKDEVLLPVLRSSAQGVSPQEIGLDNRLRLRIDMGPNTKKVRGVFRGD